ncbi:MAG: alpha/beta hydrolase [Alphaproteobacteria bacterium]|nr:alpha/beta hydrolase [Alphaproteobacteria bacterium]
MIEWTEREQSAQGVSERGFTVERAGASVPGVLWRPKAGGTAAPLILLAHGGSGHKRNERMTMLGRLFSGTFGWCAASIDGPVHGDRGPVTNSNDPEYRALWQRENPVQEMIDDWQAVLDAVSELDSIDPARIGYWGQSMGTMFGVPFVAIEKRITVAVLGKAGMTGMSPTRSGIAPYFEQYAPLVTQPVLFNVQWDDERFDRAGQLDLFDRLGSPDKRMHAYPGMHSDNGPEAFETQADFLKRYL